MLKAFQERLSQTQGVVDIRGKGLMLGIELDRPASDIKDMALAEGILLNVTAGNVIRMLPPLIITQEEAQEIVDKVSRVIQTFLQA